MQFWDLQLQSKFDPLGLVVALEEILIEPLYRYFDLKIVVWFLCKGNVNIYTKIYLLVRGKSNQQQYVRRID